MLLLHLKAQVKRLQRQEARERKASSSWLLRSAHNCYYNARMKFMFHFAACSLSLFTRYSCWVFWVLPPSPSSENAFASLILTGTSIPRRMEYTHTYGTYVVMLQIESSES
jgi:hypothetical protein